jgi:predicted tellurium resistance membrane protein TerC
LPPEEEKARLEKKAPVAMPGAAAAEAANPTSARFWSTVVVIELTDIAFAVDSILAAIALVGSAPADHPADAPHPKLWVVIVGGLLGVVLMRFAAVAFIRMLDRFPRFDSAAYLLVAVIGGKLLADWGFNSPEHPHRVNFHDWSHWEFWVFWLSMVACFCIGFLPRRTAAKDGPSA